MSASTPGPRGSSILSTGGRSVLGGIPRGPVSLVRGRSPSDIARGLLDSQASVSSAGSARSRSSDQTAEREVRARQEAEKKAEENRKAAEAKLKAQQDAATERRSELRVRTQENIRRRREGSPTNRALRERAEAVGGIEAMLNQAGDSVLGNLNRVEPTAENALRAIGDENRRAALAASRPNSPTLASTRRAPTPEAPQSPITTASSVTASPQPSPPPPVERDVLEEAEELLREDDAPVTAAASSSAVDEQAEKAAASDLDSAATVDALAAEMESEGVGDDVGEMSTLASTSATFVEAAPEQFDAAQFRDAGESLVATPGYGLTSDDTNDAMRDVLGETDLEVTDPNVSVAETIVSSESAPLSSEPASTRDAPIETLSVSEAAPASARTAQSELTIEQPVSVAIDDAVPVVDVAVDDSLDLQPAPPPAAPIEEPSVPETAQSELTIEQPVSVAIDDAAPAVDVVVDDSLDLQPAPPPAAPIEAPSVPETAPASARTAQSELTIEQPVSVTIDNAVPAVDAVDEDSLTVVDEDDLDHDDLDLAATVVAQPPVVTPETDVAAPDAAPAPVTDPVPVPAPSQSLSADEDDDFEESIDFRSSLPEALPSAADMSAAGVPDEDAAAIAAAQTPQEMADALAGLAARNSSQLIFISDPKQASEAFASIDEILVGDTPTDEKMSLIEGIEESCDDTALKFYAHMVFATLNKGDPLTEEQRQHGLRTLRDDFSFLESDTPRTPQESCDLTVSAFERVYRQVHDNLKPTIGAAFDLSAQRLAARSKEILAAQVETTSVARDDLDEDKPDRDEEDEQDLEDEDDLDAPAAGKDNSTDITFKHEGNWKQGAIVAGKGGVALAVCIAVPGFGFILAVVFLVATKNIGADKSDELAVEESTSIPAQPDALQKMLQDMDREAAPVLAETAQVPEEEEEEEEVEAEAKAAAAIPVPLPAAIAVPSPDSVQQAPAVPVVDPAVTDQTIPAGPPPASRHERGAVPAATAAVTREMHETIDGERSKLEATQSILHSRSAATGRATGITGTDVINDPTLRPAAAFSMGPTLMATATPTSAAISAEPVVSVSSAVAAETSSRDPDVVIPVEPGEVISTHREGDHRSVVLSDFSEEDKEALRGVDGLSDTSAAAPDSGTATLSSATPERGGVVQR